jgi:IclR family acetate operon transcriptional repressor
MTEAEATTYELGSLDRALEILTVLSISPGLRLADLSASLGANGTTVLRALRVLERQGFVRRAATGYRLGARLAELGHAAIASLDVAAELHDTLAELGSSQQATAHIGMYRAGMVTIVGKIEPPQPLVRYSTLGTRMPLHATAAGKAALAVLGDDYVSSLTAAGLAPYTPSTVCEGENLMRQVAETRKRRFSIEEGEYQVGFVCVASAFRVEDELYTVSLSSPFVERRALLSRGEFLVSALDRFLHAQLGISPGF